MKTIALLLSSSFFILNNVPVAVLGRNGNYIRRSDRSDRGLMPIFPSYSQQCRDDAGPPFGDDEPGTKYFNGKSATAVVGAGGTCPDPVKEACEEKPAVDAFLEGPVNCGGKGWFCRIVEQPGWPTNNLNTDLNFGSCNTTEGFDDDGFDRAGHCHGSDNDSTYYWWVRDHWFRGYNGRLRCCCDWGQVTDGGIVNSCDFRRLVTQEEDIEECRDANEEGVTPFRGGCNQNNAPPLNEPIVENDADNQCWEVQNFGEPCDDGCTNPGPSIDEEGDDDDDDDDEEDNDGSQDEEENDEEEGDDDDDDDESNDGSQDEEENDEEEGDDDDDDDEDDNDNNDEDEDEKSEDDNNDSEDQNPVDEDEEEDDEDENSCEDTEGAFSIRVKKNKFKNKNCAWIKQKNTKQRCKLPLKNNGQNNGQKGRDKCRLSCGLCTNNNINSEDGDDDDDDTGGSVCVGLKKKKCKQATACKFNKKKNKCIAKKK